MARETENKRAAESRSVLRLNLGAGATELPGFDAVDRKVGREVFPLDVDDESVEEIYASHVLEHFSHRQVQDVLRHWVAKLRPGGRIRVAVPDFEWIVAQYVRCNPINVQGYVMGGQVDDNDFHKCLFDSDMLTSLMVEAGLVEIARWLPEIKDCSALPVSLNLSGVKP